MTDSVAIALAGPDDYAAVVRLRTSFFEDQIAKGLIDIPAGFPDALSESTKSIITRRGHIILVAQSDGALVGYGFGLNKAVPGAEKGMISSIEEFYVAPEMRGGPCATLLYTSLLDQFALFGASRVQLRVLVENVGGRKFWERLGFQANVILMELDPSLIPDPQRQE